MNLKQNKKELIISVIAVLALILVGVSYAFFQAQNDSGKEAGVNVTTNTVDSLVFNITKDIVLDDINQESFASGGENKSDTSEATAVLKANNKTANAEVKEEITKTYNMYLDISENNFEYTTTAPDQKAELILNVKVSKTGNDADLEEVTTISGLNYTTVNGVSGFDVTKAEGLIKIAEDYEIKALSGATTTHKWKVTLTFVNLDSDQNANTGKTFNATLKMQKEKSVTLVSYIKDLYSTDGVNGLYLHDADLANGAGDNSLRYAGDGYVLTEKGSQTYTSIYGEESSLVKSRNATLEEYATLMLGYESLDAMLSDYGCSSVEELYNNYNVTTTEELMMKLEEEILQVYYLTYDTSKKLYANLFQAERHALKDEYVEEKIKNFVCFGSTVTPCPDDNLYRIIGVFNELNVETNKVEERIKMIKAYEAGENVLGKAPYNINSITYMQYYKGKTITEPKYYRDSAASASNIWEVSILNTETLNGTYLTKLGEYTKKIAATRWQVGGGNDAQLMNVTAPVAYQNEVGTPVNNETYDAKVGLMYVSDYGFAASSENWTANLSEYRDYNTRNNNWLYLGGSGDWTITRVSPGDAGSYHVAYSGGIAWHNSNTSYVVRPSFYLDTKVIFSGGTGTETDPIRIN